jgi:hypothetical protein
MGEKLQEADLLIGPVDHGVLNPFLAERDGKRRTRNLELS